MFYLAELKPASIHFQQFYAFYHMKPKPVFETIKTIIGRGFAAEPKVYVCHMPIYLPLFGTGR